MRNTILIGLLLATVPLAARDCETLKQLDLPGIRIDEAVASKGEPARPGSPLPAGVPALGSQATVPHCKVSGLTGDEINFELLLPDDWNGKFFQGGGGGFVGSLGYQGRFSVNRGYATVATDTGHKSNGIRAGWARGHVERVVNFGYLGVHRTAETAKAIIRAYYGAPAERSYFYGCSNAWGQFGLAARPAI